MHITIIAVGKKMPDWVNCGVDEYLKRLSANLKVTIKEVSANKRNKSTTVEKSQLIEAENINAAIAKGTHIIALDEHGKQYTTMDFSSKLDRWMSEGMDLSLVIGGADGLHPSILSQANETWSLSRLTLPHAMVRIFLVEQLYRGWSILNKHPYHRN